MNIVTSVLGIWSADVGIDLGTANTLVQSVVIRRRTVVHEKRPVAALGTISRRAQA